MKRLFVFLCTLLLTLSVGAQTEATARKILNKTAALINRRGGASANFTATGKFGTTAGSLAIKGNKFYARTGQAVVWYNGKTQWTYLKKSQEVNVSNPTEAQQQSMNPYKFVNIYKNGFKLSSKAVGGGWQVHMQAANNKRSIKEMYVTVDKNYYPKTIKMRQANGWITINVTNFRAKNLSDGVFTFNAKEYPHAEVIDLR